MKENSISHAQLGNENSLDLIAVLRRLWERRWWIVIPTVVVCFAFAIYAFVATPIYRATTVLISASQERQEVGSGLGALAQLGGLASLAGINLGGGDTETDEALAVLHSRRFIQAFIADNGLLPVLFHDRWDEEKRSWAVPQDRQPTQGDGYRFFFKTIMALDKDKRTELITLSISWSDREQAALWANNLVERLNSEMRTRAIVKANASVKHLQLELEKTSEVGTRDAINRLVEAQIRQRMLANVNEEYVFRVVDGAVTPDAKEIVSPRRFLVIGLGGLIGMVIGLGSVLLVVRKDP